MLIIYYLLTKNLPLINDLIIVEVHSLLYYVVELLLILSSEFCFLIQVHRLIPLIYLLILLHLLNNE